jgi:dihydroorotase
MELYAEAFERAGALDKLEAFSSLNGPAFYGVEPNQDTITLKREAWTLPAALPLGDQEVVPLNAGETIQWKMV